MDDPTLKSAVTKFAALGEQAGFTVEEMIRILNCGFTVEQLLDVIQIQLDKQRKDRETLLRKSG